MLRIVILLGVSALLALADGPVLKTGQTISYDTDGNVVTDGSVKDDGYYQKGVARSYTKSGDVVIDNATGLEWQDNYSDNGGDIKQTQWQNAQDYCSALSLDGESWRLPSIEELGTLPDYGRYDPAVTEDVFQYISSYYYWSSTAYVTNTSYAWEVYFNGGNSHYNYKTYNYYVRCVRGGQLEPSNLSRSGDIVTDSTTGLQWQDNDIVKTAERTWQEAIDYCENDVTLGGHNDWRLPNEKELFSIADRSQVNPAMDTSSNGFQNFSSNEYWSSTTSMIPTSYAWIVGFSNGYSCHYGKTLNFYVRCVRGGQLETSSFLPPVIMYLLD